jgi:hypothetical protein
MGNFLYFKQANSVLVVVDSSTNAIVARRSGLEKFDEIP